MSDKKIDKLSLDGFGKGKSELYNSARPRYDPQIFARIRALVPNKEKVNVVEIGCGSGIFTRGLLAHPDWADSLATLHAIDPNEGMREVFASTVQDPRVTLLNGTFDSTGVADGYADFILMAAAFHWCQDYDAAVSEFNRILKPGGVVVVAYYDADKDKEAPYYKEIQELIWAYDIRMKNATRPGRPHDHWRDVFDTPTYPKYFEPPHEETTSTSVQVTAERFISFAMTVSFIAVLPDEEKQVLREKILAVMENGEGIVWVDRSQHLFETPQKTVAISMRKKAD